MTDDSLPFRERVRAEAAEQQALRKAGKPVPSELQVYARRSGGITFAVGTLGAIGIVILGVMAQGMLYYGAAAFLFALGLGGLAQLVTGRHILTGR